MGHTTVYDKSVDSPTVNSNDNGYMNLAIAIIAKAANDYRRAYSVHNEQTCKQIRKFFTSSYLSDAFRIDLVSILEKIEKEEEKEKMNRLKEFEESYKK